MYLFNLNVHSVLKILTNVYLVYNMSCDLFWKGEACFLKSKINDKAQGYRLCRNNSFSFDMHDMHVSLQRSCVYNFTIKLPRLEQKNTSTAVVKKFVGSSAL